MAQGRTRHHQVFIRDRRPGNDGSGQRRESISSRIDRNGRALLGSIRDGHHLRPHRGTKAAHIARAALEGIAFGTMDIVNAMEQDSGIKLSELKVDGGASRNNLMMQFQADILGTTVIRPRVTETTAMGAGYLADLPQGIGNHWTTSNANGTPTRYSNRWHRPPRY